MWSRTISIEKELQAEVVVYTLDGHSSENLGQDWGQVGRK